MDGIGKACGARGTRGWMERTGHAERAGHADRWSRRGMRSARVTGIVGAGKAYGASGETVLAKQARHAEPTDRNAMPSTAGDDAASVRRLRYICADGVNLRSAGWTARRVVVTSCVRRVARVPRSLRGTRGMRLIGWGSRSFGHPGRLQRANFLKSTM